MERKEPKAITSELMSIIVSIKETNNDINIAEVLNILAKTVRRAIKLIGSNQEFVFATENRKKNWKEKNSTFSCADQIIFNTICCSNSFTQG